MHRVVRIQETQMSKIETTATYKQLSVPEEQIDDVLTEIPNYFKGLPTFPTLFSSSLGKIVSSNMRSTMQITPGSIPNKFFQLIKILFQYHSKRSLNIQGTILKSMLTRRKFKSILTGLQNTTIFSKTID